MSVTGLDPKNISAIAYLATSPSGKHYIGITSKSLEERKKTHYQDATRGSQRYFMNAIRKYGEQLSWEVLQKVDTWEEAKNLEIAYIKQYDSYNNGYNLTLGGDGVLGFSHTHTDEAKAKISIANKKSAGGFIWKYKENI